MHQSHDINGVDDQLLLDSINWFPPGSLGHQHYQTLIRILNALCRDYGYGGVPAMAAMIEDIWRRPEKAEEYRKQMAERHEGIIGTAQSSEKVNGI